MKVKIISTTGELPQYQTEGSAGMDLTANVDGVLTIPPNGRALIKTGISIELPKGYEAQIRPRSGLALKHGITVLNAPGTIDSDYRGEIGVILHNVAREDFVIKKGDRIAQMVIARYERVEWDQVDQLEISDRGQGGFGSTGVSKDEKQKLLDEYAATNGNLGTSASSMWAALKGFNRKSSDRPHDIGDFGRCLNLYNFCKLDKNDLKKVVDKMPYWEPFIKEWNTLTSLHDRASKNNWADYSRVNPQPFIQELGMLSDSIKYKK